MRIRQDPVTSGGPAFSPLYRQIKGLITRGLQAGDWKPGEAIPSETELAARFGVSQGTVRKAIDELAAENLVVRRQGRGTFVATHHEERAQFRFLRLRRDGGGDPGPSGKARQPETGRPPWFASPDPVPTRPWQGRARSPAPWPAGPMWW